MIKLIDLFKETEGGNLYIIVTGPANLLLEHSTQTLLNEGRWEESGVKDYWQRLDLPHFDYELRHVHIAHQKHINTNRFPGTMTGQGMIASHSTIILRAWRRQKKSRRMLLD